MHGQKKAVGVHVFTQSGPGGRVPVGSDELPSATNEVSAKGSFAATCRTRTPGQQPPVEVAKALLRNVHAQHPFQSSTDIKMPPKISGGKSFSNSRPKDRRSQPMEAVSVGRPAHPLPAAKWEAPLTFSAA